MYLLRILFVFYHLSHHLFLFYLINIAVSNGYLSTASGFDWEFWSLWLSWIFFWTNGTAFIKYSWNYWSKADNLESPYLSIILMFVPGIGNDIQLAKEFVFSGFCFAKASDHH